MRNFNTIQRTQNNLILYKCREHLTRNNKQGEKGAPYRSPLKGVKPGWGFPLNIIKKFAVDTQLIIKLSQDKGKPILTRTPCKKDHSPGHMLLTYQVSTHSCHSGHKFSSLYNGSIHMQQDHYQLLPASGQKHFEWYK